MNDRSATTFDLFAKHVKGTQKGVIVANRRAVVCHLTKAVRAAIGSEAAKVHITTRVIKHLYDKRPAQEFDVILKSLNHVVRYPDEIYKNLDPKRGDYGFVKKIGAELYFCSIEIQDAENMAVATIFKLPKAEAYLKNYKSLWGWRGGKSSS